MQSGCARAIFQYQAGFVDYSAYRMASPNSSPMPAGRAGWYSMD
jgi:hypothetical protein